jgi:hypothetical protein
MVPTQTCDPDSPLPFGPGRDGCKASHAAQTTTHEMSCSAAEAHEASEASQPGEIVSRFLAACPI